MLLVKTESISRNVVHTIKYPFLLSDLKLSFISYNHSLKSVSIKLVVSGGVMVIALVTGPKVRGLALERWIFKDYKIRSKNSV